MSRTSLYLPMGVVIAHVDATARATVLPEFHGAWNRAGNPRMYSLKAWRRAALPVRQRLPLGEIAQRVLHTLQLARQGGGVGRMCAISLLHRLQFAARAFHELRRGGDVGLRVVPGQVRPQDAEVGDLGAGEPGKRAGAIDQRGGGAAIALLAGVLRPAPEQIKEPAVERVLIVELGLRRWFLARRDRDRRVRLVRRRHANGPDGKEASSLDQEEIALRQDAEVVLVALGGEPAHRDEQ